MCSTSSKCCTETVTEWRKLYSYKHVVDVLRAQVIELYGDNCEDAMSAMLSISLSASSVE